MAFQEWPPIRLLFSRGCCFLERAGPEETKLVMACSVLFEFTGPRRPVPQWRALSFFTHGCCFRELAGPEEIGPKCPIDVMVPPAGWLLRVASQ